MLTKTNKATETPPTGLFIDEPSNKWKIGPCLGSGACGSVHSLQKVNTKHNTTVTTNFVVKVAPLPIKSKNKKKKKSDIEKNADLLYHEHTLYKNILVDLRGTFIPDIPMRGYNTTSSSSSSNHCPPAAFGDIDFIDKSNSNSGMIGYTFLIMERMQFPFHYIVPLLFQNIPSTHYKTIEVGSIASRLIDLIEAIHDTQRLFVDVKSENFMIAHDTTTPSTQKSSTSTRKKSIPSNQQLANRIRMIDFGLVEPIKDYSNKHRVDNYPNGQVVGTPTYASLNVLSGHTISRRDDLESIGYVILELLLQIMDFDRNKKFVSSRSSDDSLIRRNAAHVDMNVLPWSNAGAKSDDEIYSLKKNAMKNNGGSIWDMLVSANDDENNPSDIMKEYFDVVMKLDYKEKPDYDMLREIVSALCVEISGKETTTSRSNRSAARKQSSPLVTSDKTKSTLTKRATKPTVKHGSVEKRRTRSSMKASDVSELTSASLKSTRKKRITKTTLTKTTETIEFIDSDDEHPFDDFADAQQDDSDSDVEMVSIDDDSDNNDESVDVSFMSCKSMDWESIANNNENESALVNQGASTNADIKKKPIKQPPKQHALKLECIEGCHRGDTIYLTEEVIIGKNPKKGNRAKKDTFEIQDSNASDVHAKLVLNKGGSKKNILLTVRVIDMKSSNGTFVNGKQVIGSGKQAFLNDKVKIGDCIFVIKKA